MPPCFSAACARPEITSNDTAAAASACTLRMFPSHDTPASCRTDFLERYHGGASAQPATALSTLVLRTMRAANPNGAADHVLSRQAPSLPPPLRWRISRAWSELATSRPR